MITKTCNNHVHKTNNTNNNESNRTTNNNTTGNNFNKKDLQKTRLLQFEVRFRWLGSRSCRVYGSLGFEDGGFLLGFSVGA